jgi:NAD(P)-dependent dehydrogenase (short-subunit alcohol dehydrogenase family)
MDDDERQKQVNDLRKGNMFDLTGKVAVVTGGAGLLGQVFCQALVAAGAHVAIVDIDKNKADETIKKINKNNNQKVLAFACDISSPDSVSSMVNDVVGQLGRIDILLNNAASKGSDLDQFFAPFEHYSLQAWREVTAVNIDGLFLVAQSVGNQMKTQGGGSIIQISSIYGVVAPDQRIYEGSEYNGRAINTPAVYSVSKAAVIGLTSYLSAYWADSKIRVNTLTPGGIASGQNAEFSKKYSNRVPLGRMGEATELTGALIYLASDASSYVTGQNIIVDGGLSVW